MAGIFLNELLLLLMSQDGGVFASQVIEVNCTQPLNALPPMLVTELGMVTEVREEQPLNAHFPMLVTELGMEMEVREEQP